MAEDVAASNNITCPRCGVVYPVDARAFSGSEVRCKRCNHVFTAGSHSGQAGDPFNITRSFPVFPELKADPAATPPPAMKTPVLLPEPTPPRDASRSPSGGCGGRRRRGGKPGTGSPWSWSSAW